MAGPSSGAPSDASLFDTAINGSPGTPPAAAGAAGAAPPSPMSGLFPTRGILVWIPDASGQLVAWIVDPTTGQSFAAKGPDGKQLTKPAGSPTAPVTRKIGDRTQQWDPVQQQWIDPPGADTTLTTAPKDTVPGSGTAPSYTPGLSTDPSDPSAHVGQTTQGTPDLPVDVYTAQNTAKNDAAARAIGQQNADTSTANSAENARQNAIQNARTAAQDAWQRGQADISNQLAQGRLSLDQAQLAASNLHAQISEDLQRSSQALTARGQNLDYLSRQSFVTAGQYGALQDAEAGAARSGGVPFTPSPTPAPLGYDPSQIGAMLAKQVLGQTQSQGFSMGGNPTTGTGFIPPNNEQGGLQTNNPAAPPLSVAARR